jgi:NADH-quinone oxidoreductase subunit J
MADTIFYILAGTLILLSLLVVSVPNLLHAALSLIGAFFATAALYLLFQMEFVALAQIMIYIGGIVVFMVITILLTAQLGGRNLFAKTPGQRLWGLLVSLSLFAVLYKVSRGFELETTPLAKDAEPASLTAIGTRLLSPEPGGFVVPFEVISILLLTALIGAVVIARRAPRPPDTEQPPVHREIQPKGELP